MPSVWRLEVETFDLTLAIFFEPKTETLHMELPIFYTLSTYGAVDQNGETQNNRG